VNAALVELIFVFGVVLGLGCFELWRVDRAIRRDRADEDD
jgi:hypothetical protein